MPVIVNNMPENVDLKKIYRMLPGRYPYNTYLLC